MAKKKKINLNAKNENVNGNDLGGRGENNNGSNSNYDDFQKLKIPMETGFYWYYQGVLFFNNHFGSDGFNKEDVEKIAPQVKKASALSSRLYQEQYVLVKRNGERFYVHINDLGYVFLPKIEIDENNRKVYGKTDDPKKVKDFKSVDNWFLKK